MRNGLTVERRKFGKFKIQDLTLVTCENDEVQGMMWNRYGDYLVQTAGEEARDRCFKEIEVEDTPRPLTYQLELLRKCGFRQIDVLHKNACFATFGAVK